MIDLNFKDSLAEITLNEPAKLNVLDEQALKDLHQAYQEAEKAGARALILTGEGRAFCAGRDISDVDPQDDDVMAYLDGLLTPLLRTISSFPAPTFASAQGACLGVGLGLLIATDVVYVADTAKIGSPFAALGATLDSGGHSLFYERLGSHKTLDLIYSGRLMSGLEAVESGLFSQVFAADQLEEKTYEAALKASTGATQAFLASKGLIASLRAERMGLWESLNQENLLQTQLCESEDYREGFSAFQEKRTPSFRGR